MAGSSTTAQQAQQELDSAMGDLLGDADDWDNEEEEDEEEGGREGGGGEQGGGGKTEPANASQARGATRYIVYMFDLACFFLPSFSHLSLKRVYEFFDF